MWWSVPISLAPYEAEAGVPEPRNSGSVLMSSGKPASSRNANTTGVREITPSQPGLHSEIPDQKQTTNLLVKHASPLCEAEFDALALQNITKHNKNGNP